jgi:hypothetical protein
MTTAEMNKVINNRIAEMIKNEQIQKIMMDFKTKEEAKDWIYKAAIATLLGVHI